MHFVYDKTCSSRVPGLTWLPVCVARPRANDTFSYNGRTATDVGVLPADGSTSVTGRILSFGNVVQ